jgi:hypothetical protein
MAARAVEDREVRIDVRVHGAREVAALISEPPVARATQVPAAIDDPERRVAQARGDVVDRDEGVEGHPRSMPARLEVDVRLEVGG